MLRTYGLAIEKTHGLVALNLPRMSLAQAESARERMSTYANVKGLNILVINFAAE